MVRARLHRRGDGGVQRCAALGRVDGVVLDVAVFTNLSQDHLDFHPRSEDYFAAKARLFTPRLARAARRRRRRRVRPRLVAISGVPTRTCSVHGAGPDARARTGRRVDVHSAGRARPSRCTVPAGERVEVRLQLPGEFNVANATCALAALATVGVPLPDAARGIAALHGVPGRMEPVAPASRTSHSSTTRTRRTR